MSRKSDLQSLIRQKTRRIQKLREQEAVEGVSVDPGILVISGALAPTGFFGGCTPNGCDDWAYNQEMAAAGAANYMDCVGVHYNAGATSPSASSGHPADDGGGHYTWYFQGMVNAYSVVGKPLCFTELGYL